MTPGQRALLPEFERLLRPHLDAGLELQTIAEVLDVKPPTLSRWINGRRTVPPGFLDQLRRAIPKALAAQQRKFRDQARGLGASR